MTGTRTRDAAEPAEPGDAAGTPNAPGSPHPSEWDRVHASFASHDAESRRIAEWVGLEPGGRVIDMACGTGQHLMAFARMGHPCFGADQLWWKLSRAKRIAAMAQLTNIHFVCSDLRFLRLRVEHDLVICVYAMSMMRRDEDLDAALASARRLLSPKGRFVFNVIGRNEDEDPETSYRDAHLRTHSREDVESFLARAGLEAVDFEAKNVPGLGALDLNYVCRRQE